MAIIGGAAIGAVASVGSAAMAKDAAGDAADAQAKAARRASDQQREDMKPWMDAGKGALERLTAGLADGGEYAKKFTMEDATNSEAMKFAMSQGREAIENSAASRGGLLTTNTLHDLGKFGAGVGAQYQNQAFNQWMREKESKLGADQSLAQVGQTSTQNVADTTGNMTLAASNARASGIVGQNNAVQTGISNTIPMLSKLFGTDVPTSSPYTTPNLNGTYNNPTYSDPGMGVNPNNVPNAAPGVNPAGDYSDERLKDNVKRVGSTDSGLPIYTYTMKGGGPVRMGVMAQDVEKLDPSVVSHDRHGLKMVDYARI